MSKGAITAESLLSKTSSLRWEVGEGFHDALMESIYTDAASIADTVVTHTNE